jgi:hypothetical protein
VIKNNVSIYSTLSQALHFNLPLVLSTSVRCATSLFFTVPVGSPEFSRLVFFIARVGIWRTALNNVQLCKRDNRKRLGAEGEFSVLESER